MDSEPIVIVNAIAAAVEAVLIVAVSVGFALEAEAIASIGVAVVAVGTAVATYIGRSRVYAPDTVAHLVAEAVVSE